MNTHHLSLLRRYDGPISCPPWCSSTEAEHLTDLNDPRIECATHFLDEKFRLPSGRLVPVRMAQDIEIDDDGGLSTDAVSILLSDPGAIDEMSVSDTLAFGALLADFARNAAVAAGSD